jgi:hypothetical protein
MLNGLIEWSINKRFIVIVLAVVWALVGIYLTAKTNVDVFPEFAPPQVVVQTEAPGMVAEEVETLVTLPLEVALNGMPGRAEKADERAVKSEQETAQARKDKEAAIKEAAELRGKADALDAQNKDLLARLSDKTDKSKNR